jgi:tripartite-type tricarboxylate transporter receptor subunit TctC
MKSLLQRSNVLSAALAATMLFAAAAPAHAAYPDHPIRWIVPFPAGGAMDNIARTLGETCRRRWPGDRGRKPSRRGRQHRRRNGGALAGRRLHADHRRQRHGRESGAVRQAQLRPGQGFRAGVAAGRGAQRAGGQQGEDAGKTVAEVIASAKAKPGKYTYASAGNGTSIHLAGELFTSMAHVDMLHIPYKGSGPAMTDLLGGQVDYMFDSITSAKPHIDSGKLTAIAVTTSKRSSALPNVPTVAEAGLPGYELSPWFAAFVPAKTRSPSSTR